MKVTKANDLNASHLIPTLRPEKIMAFEAALATADRHAAGPGFWKWDCAQGRAALRATTCEFRTAGPAAWCAEAPPRSPKSHDLFWPKRRDQMAGVQRLCFGDFHLAQQMKVTRPPGRIPGIGLTQ